MTDQFTDSFWEITTKRIKGNFIELAVLIIFIFFGILISSMFNPITIWTLLSFIYTFIYSVIFLLKSKKRGIYNEIGGDNTFKIIAPSIALFIFIIFLISNNLNLLNIIFEIKLIHEVTILFCITIFFVRNNWLLYKIYLKKENEANFASKIKYSNSRILYENAVFKSDLPVSISIFLLLLITYVKPFENVDIFLSGAVIFQIFYSNIVWLFFDNPTNEI